MVGIRDLGVCPVCGKDREMWKKTGDERTTLQMRCLLNPLCNFYSEGISDWGHRAHLRVFRAEFPVFRSDPKQSRNRVKKIQSRNFIFRDCRSELTALNGILF